MNAPERIMPTGFEVSLPVTQDIVVQLKLADGALITAQSYEIDSPDMAQIVADQRNVNLKNIATLKELKKGFVAPAKAIIANAESLFDPAIEELGLAKDCLNGKLLGWQQSEDKRIAQERAEREAAERKARQEAERKAAEERARAEAVAAEQRRKEAEAEAARVQAVKDGNARAAASAAAAVARAREAAVAAIENGNARAADVQMQATAIAAAAPVAEITKITGNSFRENWVAEFKPGLDEETVKLLIVKAICGNAVNSAAARPELLALLDLNMSACNKTAKAFKTVTSIPGMVAVDRPITAGRK